MDIKFICLMIILITFILGLIFINKTETTSNNRMIIFDAIQRYNRAILEGRIKSVDILDYDRFKVSNKEMEDYDKTLFRLWDWGYKNIVPKEVLEKIRPFINERS